MKKKYVKNINYSKSRFIMSEDKGNRGIRGILVSQSYKPCPVPFTVLPVKFECDKPDTDLFLSVEDGKGVIDYRPKENNEEEDKIEPEFDTKYEIKNGEFTEDQDIDDETKLTLKKINKHIHDSVSEMYDLPITNLFLHFGKKDDKIYLLHDSSCSTSTSSIESYKNDTDFDTKFCEFFFHEVHKPVDHNVCITNHPDCGPPDYRVPRSLFLLYKAEKEFPKADPGQLRLMINLRLGEDNPLDYVCIHCYHLFSGAERVAVCADRERLTFQTLPPATFQPLVPAELEAKGKKPVGIHPKMNHPYWFALNVVNSPYNVPPPSVKKPPHSRYAKARAIPKEPEWAARLSSPIPPNLSGRAVSRGYHPQRQSMPTKPFYPEGGKPIERVKRNYQNPPFDISMLDPKRKKRLHKGNEEHFYRFSNEPS